MLQGEALFFHPDVEIISTVQGNGLRLITDVGYDNSGIRRDIHTKFSFGIGDNTIGGPFFKNVGTDNRFAFGVRHLSSYNSHFLQSVCLILSTPAVFG